MAMKDKLKHYLFAPENLNLIKEESLNGSREIKFFLSDEAEIEDFNFDSFRKCVIDFDSRGELINKNSRNTLKKMFSKNPNKNLAVKKFGQNGIYDNLRFRFLTSRALRSFSTALRLKSIEISVPEPLACIEVCGTKNKLINSYYIYKFIDFEFDLNDFYQCDNNNHNREKLIRKLASNIKRMHDHGIVHGDLQPFNIHFKTGNSSDRIYFIDFNRASHRDKLSLRARAKDLHRLRMPEDFKYEFLSFYSEENQRVLSGLIDRFLKRLLRRKSVKRKLENILGV